MNQIIRRRRCGRVAESGGEYAETEFDCFIVFPLVPMDSYWTRIDRDGVRSSIKLPLRGRSVAAAYLRWWAPVAALVTAIAARHAIGVPLVVGLVGLLGMSAWAWTWRTERGELALRRRAFNRVAFGTRCDPAAMFIADRAELVTDLRAKWEASSSKRSPLEISRLGAVDAGEAVIAYGLLRLAELEKPGRTPQDRRDLRAAADEILRGVAAARAGGGPYRNVGLADPAQVIAAVTAAAASGRDLVAAPALADEADDDYEEDDSSDDEEGDADDADEEMSEADQAERRTQERASRVDEARTARKHATERFAAAAGMVACSIIGGAVLWSRPVHTGSRVDAYLFLAPVAGLLFAIDLARSGWRARRHALVTRAALDADAP